jgi:hypothetical protein
MKCNRTVCTNEADPRLVHRDLKKTYCLKCATNINRLCGTEVIPIPTPDSMEKENRNDAQRMVPKERQEG